MAELVHDLAPDARLVLVGYRTIDQFEEAAAWIASQGIPIVSHSNSFLTPPFDGTGRAARAVDAAAAAGVLWVNSAGNYGQRHWRGSAPPGGAVIPIAPAAGTPLLLFSLCWSAAGVAASVAIEHADAAGAWIEVQRSAPAGPGTRSRRPSRRTPARGGWWCDRTRAPRPSSACSRRPSASAPWRCPPAASRPPATPRAP